MDRSLAREEVELVETIDLSEFEKVPPRADAMFEALRAFGYTLEAAVADIVDNSIYAGTKNVWIDFHWSGPQSHITILDDGRGMATNELTEAMRVGSKSPLEERNADDLGRFGLGLKTASLSQCRLLTVRSKTASGHDTTRSWDLDLIDKLKDWELRKHPLSETEPLLSMLNNIEDHGTLVIWQRLDRVVDQSGTDSSDAKNRFLSKVEIVERHIAMTFHRFISGKDRLRIHINNKAVKAWDPFLKNEDATQELSKEALEIFGKSLNVHPFVLPHKSRLDETIHELAAGPRGWNAQQGFYIYRNERLIVPGSWLDLGFKQEEHYKLARIQVDIPNTLDHEWRVDVKKGVAYPPGALIGPMIRIAKVTRARASEVYRNRGRILKRKHALNYELVWERRSRHNSVFFKINRSHPIVRDALDLPSYSARKVRELIELVENTVPLQTIVMENAEHPDCFTDSDDWEFKAALERRAIDIFNALTREGLEANDAYERVASIEPFDRMPSVLAKLESLLGN